MEKLSKRICVIGPCLTMGGMERASVTLANTFSEMGHEVMYLAIFKHPAFFSLSNEVRFDEPTDGTNITKLHFFSTIRRIRSKVTEFQPDSVVVFNKFYSAIALVALAGTDYPVFISERSSPLFKWRRGLALFMRIAFSLFPPKGVVAQTSIAAFYQKKYFTRGTPISVIPNPLRTRAPIAKEKQNYILAVGRLNDPLKGFDRLIEAFSKVKRPGWKLVFAGDVENGELLVNLSKQLQIADRVVFLGKVREMDEVYALSPIFVIPSRSEGFPNALCEAMGAGLACISFDFVAGPRDIIDHRQNGLLVKNGDTSALAQAIQYLIDNEQERIRLGGNALAIRDRLSQSNIGRAWMAFMFNGSDGCLRDGRE